MKVKNKTKKKQYKVFNHLKDTGRENTWQYHHRGFPQEENLPSAWHALVSAMKP